MNMFKYSSQAATTSLEIKPPILCDDDDSKTDLDLVFSPESTTISEGKERQLAKGVAKQSEKPNWRRRIFNYVFLAFVVIAAIIGLSITFFGSPNPMDFFVQQHPPGMNETHLWWSGGNNGLSLVIENALNEFWTPYLVEYVTLWDQGIGPYDPLSLSITRSEPDFACDPFPGRIKVCNGDYGRNDWRGINIALLQNGYIVHSVAKMNDYWLMQEGEDFMKYTM
jgi:hypothetical protein